jgi:glycosyltransferase involved in cell wall biosynthesis
MTSLRLGLNLTYLLADSGGSGSYARELIPALMAVEPEIRITGFVNADSPDSVLHADWAGEVDWVRFPIRPQRPGPLAPLLSMAAQWGALPAAAARRRLDVVHGLANVVPPLHPRVATVVTILDLIWLRHTTTMTRRATLGMRLAVPPSARTANRVIAISHAAREDLVRTLGLRPAKVDVTHLGVRLDETVSPSPEPKVRERLAIGPGPLVLCVAQVRPHKNLGGLVRALALLPDRAAQLVVVGAHTGHEAELRELAREAGVEARVHLPGWVSDEDLEGLYGAAACFALPSFEEGFGLPLLEAMRRGTPVACSDASSLPEVAGDAAVLFDPHDPKSIAAALERLLSDDALRARLVERGLARCREFTWEATARATLESYRRALASAPRAGRGGTRA